MSDLAIKGGQPVRSKLFPAYRVIGEEEKQAVARVMDSGILSRFLGCWDADFYGGPEVQALEKEWSEYFKVKYAISVNSCTSGLQAAVGAAGIGPGDEVIVSPFTMAASVTAPLIYGGVPVFADIEPEHFCLDPKSVEAKITSKTKAIIVVDIFGQPYDREGINAVAKKYNLIVIEDAAQAPGAMLNGEYAGTLGHIGVFSLNYHKHIHTGEGGMIVTNDPELAERVQLIRNHAEAVVEDKKTTNLVNMVGFNFRLTEIQAAIGREQLKKLAGLLNERISNCNYLAEKLAQFPGIKAAPLRPGAKHSYYVQPFLYDASVIGVERNKFIAAVKAELPATELREAEGQQISVGYCKPLYLLPMFQKKIAIGGNGFPFTAPETRPDISYAKGDCPVVEKIYEEQIFIHEFMRPPATREDLDDVVKAFAKVYEHRLEI